MQDSVRSLLAAAGAKGMQFGRPQVSVDESRIAEFHVQGRGWKSIAAELGVGVGTILRVAKNLSEPPPLCLAFSARLFFRFEDSANKWFLNTRNYVLRRFPHRIVRTVFVPGAISHYWSISFLLEPLI